MAVAAGVLSEQRRQTLEALFDTFVPAVQSDDDPGGMLGRSASDMGLAPAFEEMISEAMLPEEIEAIGQLLDAIAEQDLPSQPQEAREAIVKAMQESGLEAKLGIHSLKAAAMTLFYALPDDDGRNPNWEGVGYPGPRSAPPSPEGAPKTIPLTEVLGDSATLEADVVVIGSGAGGGVIAAELQKAGRSVLVLEQGAYRNEADFTQLELVGMQELYLNGGPFTSETGSIAIYAGSTLGGGTVVNYMNCLRTPDPIRTEWASHGLEGLDGPDYDAHLDAVWERLGVNAEATSQNRTHKRLIAGLDALGHEHSVIFRNADLRCDDPATCGYCSGGCQKGCKQSTLKTFLQDAADSGARFVVNCVAERVTAEDGRTTGVEACVRHEDGSTTDLRVEAPTVVVACGSVESPALLLRSKIGGPATGRNLRLHPAALVIGVYDDPIEGWIGQIQSEVSDSFADLEGEHGFLIEGVGVAPALVAASLPWATGEDHKRNMTLLPHMAPFISVQRDHGAGEVVLDAHGRAVVRWNLDDETDRRVFVRANQELVRLHEAAGAARIITLHREPTSWSRGEDLDAFLGGLESASWEAGDVTMFTAHQLGACRMGSDPKTSVADGRGELHETKGVWIGDASAFPTASGVNPMISIMGLAHRTASAIAAG
ncbi:MAG: GMC family oxidoreductase [Actinomycetota bacterium]